MKYIMKVDEFKTMRANLCDHEVIVLKFGATWCNPCEQIKPLVSKLVKKLPQRIRFYEIDIDESVELYMAFKSKKMVKGVPTLLAFYGKSENDVWYIPDEIVSGANNDGIHIFFESIINETD